MRHSWPRTACFAAVLLVLAIGPLAARQLGSRPVEEWIQRLERPERVKDLRVDEVIGKLGLKQGQVVADLGAGPLVFGIPLAKAVGPKGKVYAVEIEQDYVDYMHKKLKSQDVTNVQPVLGKYTDANLPAKDVDLAFFHDVLHHVEDRATYLKNLAPYVKPSGRIAVVELDPVTGSHRDEPHLRLTKEQVAAWMADAGFKPVEEHDFLKDKWFVVYARQ